MWVHTKSISRKSAWWARPQLRTRNLIQRSDQIQLVIPHNGARGYWIANRRLLFLRARSCCKLWWDCISKHWKTEDEC